MLTAIFILAIGIPTMVWLARQHNRRPPLPPDSGSMSRRLKLIAIALFVACIVVGAYLSVGGRLALFAAWCIAVYAARKWAMNHKPQKAR